MADEQTGRPIDVAATQFRLKEFASERDWEQFHSPKNLAMALAGEVGELIEIFQWLTTEQSNLLSPEDRSRAEDELADIQIYLLRLADVLGLSLADAVDAKIQRNEDRYPVQRSMGNATRAARKDSD